MLIAQQLNSRTNNYSYEIFCSRVHESFCTETSHSLRLILANVRVHRICSLLYFILFLLKFVLRLLSLMLPLYIYIYFILFSAAISCIFTRPVPRRRQPVRFSLSLRDGRFFIYFCSFVCFCVQLRSIIFVL